MQFLTFAASALALGTTLLPFALADDLSLHPTGPDPVVPPPQLGPDQGADCNPGDGTSANVASIQVGIGNLTYDGERRCGNYVTNGCTAMWTTFGQKYDKGPMKTGARLYLCGPTNVTVLCSNAGYSVQEVVGKCGRSPWKRNLMPVRKRALAVAGGTAWVGDGGIYVYVTADHVLP